MDNHCPFLKGDLVEVASRLETVAPGVYRWEFFSNHHQVELTSHAVVIRKELFLFDPIPLAEGPFRQLRALGRPAAILVTNANHLRDAPRWQEILGIPLLSSVEANLSARRLSSMGASVQSLGPWRVSRLVGGTRGELAFRWPERSLVIIGDAVTHLPKYGLNILTRKYCQDQDRLRHSLRQFVVEPFEQLLMAHGRPLAKAASKKVGKLVQ